MTTRPAARWRGGLLLLAAGLIVAPVPAGARADRDLAATRYARLLDDYLVVISKPGDPLLTRFDYARFHSAKDHAQRLAEVRAQLTAAHAGLETRTDRLAWAINTYNFFVIAAVVEHLEAFTDPGASIMNVRIGERGAFDAPLIEIDEHPYSLNDFERTFIFAGFDRTAGKPPPRALDARAHFALVCAAQGCPPLLPTPYRGDSLDAQLEWVTRQALASPVHLRWDETTSRLEASSVFDWYARDFGGPQAALAFLVRYAPAPIRRAMVRAGIERIEHFIPWDWRLNQAPRK